MTNPSSTVCIVGAGPIGLHTAHQLINSGYEVTVISADLPATRSATFAGPAAAGLIEPVATEPEDAALVTDLFRTSYTYWLSLVGDTALGVDFRRVRFRVGDHEAPPQWFDEVANLTADGPTDYSFDTAVVTPMLWLSEIRRRLKLLGVDFRQRRLARPDELTRLTAEFSVVINATGPGAWALGDPDMYGRRGVLVWVAPHPALTKVHFDNAAFLYAIPQRHRVALGGTSDPVFGNPGSWRRHPTDHEVQRILAGVAQLCPGLSADDLSVLDTSCDYRPCRSRLRLDLVSDAGRRLLHLTGFGGSGWTLAPAVADWVSATLASEQPLHTSFEAAG